MKPGKWTLMNILYMPVKGIDFVSVYGFRSDFEIVPTMWYFVVVHFISHNKLIHIE